MNRDKIGSQTYYIHQCTKRYVDVHTMSVSQSCLCSFSILDFKFIYLHVIHILNVYLHSKLYICICYIQVYTMHFTW